jgi:hypothetical protein
MDGFSHDAILFQGDNTCPLNKRVNKNPAALGNRDSVFIRLDCDLPEILLKWLAK